MFNKHGIKILTKDYADILREDYEATDKRREYKESLD